MIDFSNEIYTALRTVLKTAYPTIEVSTEYIESPSKFPCVTIDETYNIPVSKDSGTQKYSAITYRVQIFTTGQSKRADARAIYKTVSDKMYALNLMGKTYTTTPAIYNSAIYEIQATFEGSINSSGVIFRR